MAVPNLTDEERAKALKLALENRTKRAEIRKKLSNGELSAKEVQLFLCHSTKKINRVFILSLDGFFFNFFRLSFFFLFK